MPKKTKRRKLIVWFENLGMRDVGLVGGKNAALGEMISNLKPLGIKIPSGFAITAQAYDYFLEKSGVDKQIKEVLSGLDTHNLKDLQNRGKLVRRLIVRTKMPDDLAEEIIKAYQRLGKKYGISPDVAVRSSATAEDLPGASFAGQQETYLNVVGHRKLLEAVKKCFASLFTDRAISYRQDKGFAHTTVSLSVGVQKMVRSDLGASGVAFSIDTETGFDKVVVINGAYGLGEMVVQGQVTPDEFIVFKPALKGGFTPVISKTLGKKDVKLVYSKRGTIRARVAEDDQLNYCLSDAEVVKLASWTVTIEDYFSKKYGRYQPMDVEWAKDGKTKELFIVQARPETVHSIADKNVYLEYKLAQKGEILAKGTAVGSKIATGPVRVIRNVKNIKWFQKGEVLVTEITDPDWEPIMKIASAIVTDKGGRTSHAAIVSLELGIPCIVGTGNATSVLKDKEMVTVDCSSGMDGLVYKGELKFKTVKHYLKKIPETRTKIMINIGSPEEAFKNHYLPVKGVGLGRLEFIIASKIRIHPNALLEYDRTVKKGRPSKLSRELVSKIEELSADYKDKSRYYSDEMAEGIAKIAVAFWPNDVIIRFSDFKTNEYRTLVGGELYEPEEENPMIGWRGASRYADPKFAEAFGLECRALKKVRDEFGLKNVVPMVPFCRTPEEGKKVINIMAKHGLNRQKDSSLKIYVMCEIPSNVLLADQFLDLFDGMSIGSNDLTQLTVGLDRDSGIVNKIANEKDESVKKLIAKIIKKCRIRSKYVGICGQAPSDFPDFAEFLVSEGIESMSLNPDTIISILNTVAKKEKSLAAPVTEKL